MEAVATIDYASITKLNAKEYAKKLADIVNENAVGVKAPEAYAQLKAINQMTTETMALILDTTIKQVKEYGGEKLIVNGFNMTTKEAGSTYHYEKCNDFVLQDMYNKLALLKESIKERETFLKTIKGSLDIVTADGEAVTIYPPYKTSTTTINCG